jgi:hypothetical protein
MDATGASTDYHSTYDDTNERTPVKLSEKMLREAVAQSVFDHIEQISYHIGDSDNNDRWNEITQEVADRYFS